MGEIRPPIPVKLFIGVLFSSLSVYEETVGILMDIYGPIDKESAQCNFDFTDYYEKEMGTSLFRKFISFKRLISPQSLKDIKIYTNYVEQEMSKCHAPPPRPINLDPGYLNLSKVILATTKDYTHRIYLGDGIYGEVTLYYKKKNFCSWNWTYPDYKIETHKIFFSELRTIYKEQIS